LFGFFLTLWWEIRINTTPARRHEQQ
jgi:hypothetical protein